MHWGTTIGGAKIGIEKLCKKLRLAGLEFDKVSEPKTCNIVAIIFAKPYNS